MSAITEAGRKKIRDLRRERMRIEAPRVVCRGAPPGGERLRGSSGCQQGASLLSIIIRKIPPRYQLKFPPPWVLFE
jgi:hypothetical protein